MGMFWAKVKLTAPSMLGGRFKPRPLADASAALKETIEQAVPKLRSYERLAAVYHEYARSFCPDYTAFLRTLAKKRRVELCSALDLACGAGTLTAQLAALAQQVVAVDLSHEMIAEAQRRCAALGNVRFEQGDFRNFDIGRQFDAVVCGSDSLNYIEQPDELAKVFRSVARHLAPRGLFVCDALDDRGLRLYAGKYIPIQLNGTECSIVLQYDATNRVSHSLAVFGSEVEVHRRIPIEPAQVCSAAESCGLTVLDWFSVAGFGLLKYGGIRNFFVLQKELA